MRRASGAARRGANWLWPLAYAVLGLYVAARMGVFALSAETLTASGIVRLPNTFASVDHPFHVARAEMLWRALGSGDTLRWIGQHQGGYPVEFYPLGEAGLEVLIRAASIGALTAAGAHTLAVAAIFLLPGLAYAALAQLDGWPPVVGFLALALHVALPGSWYHGGYTELVQWGLITNVAAAAAALLMLPLLVRFLQQGEAWTGAAASVVAAWALYCNPRSAIGLTVLAAGACVSVLTLRPSASVRIAPLGGGIAAADVAPGSSPRSPALRLMLRRLAVVGGIAALLAAPLLASLIRFRDLYRFVHYSGYETVGDYVAASAGAVSGPIVGLGLLGLGVALLGRYWVGMSAAAVSYAAYTVVTVLVAFVPWTSQLAPQLEPTRLMPLQRYLVIYLAAGAWWLVVDRLIRRFAAPRRWLSVALAGGLAVAVLVVQTRPLSGPAPDPASPAIPPVSLYPVAMSAQPQQFELELAVRAADEAAEPGTALVVVGSALSWHQQLWAPLWTERPLYFDNWLWYWRPDHAGTPGYRFLAGNHYPDPEAVMDPGYLARHGIGAVVVTGTAREAAARSPLLEPIRAGAYDAYVVVDPVTTVTFGNNNAALLRNGLQAVDAIADGPAGPVRAAVNWHPRWAARADGRAVSPEKLETGYISVDPGAPARSVELTYGVQPWDWAARGAVLVGVVGLGRLVSRRSFPGP